MRQARLKNDLLSGLLMLALGLTFAWLSSGLKFGSASRMGAGFVPTLLSWSLVVIGVVLVTRSGRSVEFADEWPTLRAVSVICLSPVVFGLLIQTAGLVITVVATSVLARLAMHGRIQVIDIISAVTLAAFCSLVFVIILGQSLSIWPS